MLNGVKPAKEAGLRVLRIDRHHLLQEDRPVIHLLIDEMDRHAGDLDSPRQRIADGMRPGEGRQERRMDIQEAMRISSDEARRENPHETRQTNEPDAVRPAALKKGAFIVRARGIGVGVDMLGFHTGTPRPWQGIRVSAIAQDEGYARAQSPCARGIQDRLQIRALAGAEHRQRGKRWGWRRPRSRHRVG